jgi:hypothetical protein
MIRSLIRLDTHRYGLLDETVKVLYRMKAAGIQPTEHMINEVNMACANLIDLRSSS